MENQTAIEKLNQWISEHAHRLSEQELAEYSKLWDAAYGQGSLPLGRIQPGAIVTHNRHGRGKVKKDDANGNVLAKFATGTYWIRKADLTDVRPGAATE